MLLSHWIVILKCVGNLKNVTNQNKNITFFSITFSTIIRYKHELCNFFLLWLIQNLQCRSLFIDKTCPMCLSEVSPADLEEVETLPQEHFDEEETSAGQKKDWFVRIKRKLSAYIFYVLTELSFVMLQNIMFFCTFWGINLFVCVFASVQVAELRVNPHHTLLNYPIPLSCHIQFLHKDNLRSY